MKKTCKKIWLRHIAVILWIIENNRCMKAPSLINFWIDLLLKQKFSIFNLTVVQTLRRMLRSHRGFHTSRKSKCHLNRHFIMEFIIQNRHTIAKRTFILLVLTGRLCKLISNQLPRAFENYKLQQVSKNLEEIKQCQEKEIWLILKNHYIYTIMLGQILLRNLWNRENFRIQVKKIFTLENLVRFLN